MPCVATNYGRVLLQMLDRKMEYNTQQPIETVFDAVQDFALMENQTVASKACLILNKTDGSSTVPSLTLQEWRISQNVDASVEQGREESQAAILP
jgi:hypothetical protein